MDSIVAAVISPVASSIIEGHKSVLRNFILNLENKTPSQVTKWLKMGDELCRGRMIPMSSQLIDKVIDIYKRCQSSKGDTALMLALDMGLMDMAWGFIECAKQTNTNLHTSEKGEEYVQDLFWLSNEKERTAFDIAIEKGHVEVAKLLLNNAPRRCLISEWNKRRKDLLHLLNEPKYDRFIFDMLAEDEQGGMRSTWTSVKIDIQRELKIYNKGVERILTPEFLDNLGNGLLGSKASNNTILHLLSKIGNVACIKYILEKDPSQIHSRNSDMETPAYVAAREGRVDILQYMINILKAKNNDIESIVTRSTDKQNALHTAIQNHHVEVIFVLIKEIPQLANCINESKESPLYLAAERQYFGVVELMLNKCTEIAFEGPNEKTALHAAAISNSAECLHYLLNRKRDLLNVRDKSGWTPLCHAVYHNSSSATKKLLDVDNSIGYQLILEDGAYTSAIHIAASRGHCETMQVLMDMCLGCSEFTDSKGRNILHVAVEHKKNKVIEFIFQDDSLTNLINQKDINGNTPIHLLIASDFEEMEMLMDSRVNINTLNNYKLTPLGMISSDGQKERLIKAIALGTSIHNKRSPLSPQIVWEAKEKKSETKVEKTERHFEIVDNLVLVAALIATASFAAAFTVPGGFYSSESDGSKQGTPFLLREAAFQAFIVTNAIAFSSSCSVLLGHIALVFYRNRYDEASLDEQGYIDRKVEDMFYLTTMALLAMIIAFVTGLYVVITPSHVLAISVCVMSLLILAYNSQIDRFAEPRKVVDTHVPAFFSRLSSRSN